MLDDPSRFRVLFVCTGNIHRSAMAERLLLSRMDSAAPVSVASAGMAAVVGHPMAEHSMVAVAELGADPSEHVARQYVPQLAERADLILTAERGQRARILEDSPRAMRRTYPLRYLARLCAPLPPASSALTVDELRDSVARLADVPRLPTEASDDIDDPVRAGLDETRRRAREIADCVDVLVRAFGLAPSGG